MQDPINDIRQYQDHLDNLLGQLKNKLDVQCKTAVASHSGLESLDEYVLELNTFYYESFHRRFFPLYEQLVKEDIRGLYNISQQESALRNNIVANLKQHVRLFNRLKYTGAILQQKRQETQTFWREYRQRHEEQTVGLLYILKEAAADWNSFLALLHNLQVVMEDDKLLTALKQYPAHAAAALLFQDWKPDNSKKLRDFNRLLATWQLGVKLLGKFQAGPAADRESFSALIDELRKIDTGWDNRKVPSPVRTWYQQYIQKSYRLHLDALSLSGEKKERRNTARTAIQFSDWLNSWLIVIEQCLVYETRGWDHLIRQLTHLNQVDMNYLQELDKYATKFVQSVGALIESLAASSQADYHNHSQQGTELLSSAGQYWQQQLEGSLRSRLMVLAPQVEQLKNQTGLMEDRIELMDEQKEFYDYAGRQYQAMVASLDSYLELLYETSEELKRIWSPHNSKNIFQDMDLKIEHIAITVGSQFPPQYNHLIDAGIVSSQPADAPEGRVLYEEGDIFVIHLDKLTETEVPKIVVAKKG